MSRGRKGNVKGKSNARRQRPSEKLNLEFFEPINRAAEKLKTGDSVRSVIYKKLTGTKEKIVGATQDDFDKFG